MVSLTKTNLSTVVIVSIFAIFSSNQLPQNLGSVGHVAALETSPDDYEIFLLSCFDDHFGGENEHDGTLHAIDCLETSVRALPTFKDKLERRNHKLMALLRSVKNDKSSGVLYPVDSDRELVGLIKNERDYERLDSYINAINKDLEKVINQLQKIEDSGMSSEQISAMQDKLKAAQTDLTPGLFDTGQKIAIENVQSVIDTLDSVGSFPFTITVLQANIALLTMLKAFYPNPPTPKPTRKPTRKPVAKPVAKPSTPKTPTAPKAPTKPKPATPNTLTQIKKKFQKALKQQKKKPKSPIVTNILKEFGLAPPPKPVPAKPKPTAPKQPAPKPPQSTTITKASGPANASTPVKAPVKPIRQRRGQTKAETTKAEQDIKGTRQ